MVHELTYDSILDFKLLQKEWGFHFGTDVSGQNVNWNETKMLKVTKENPFLLYLQDILQGRKLQGSQCAK